MSKRVLPMLDDPTTHSSVRDLLQAGRDANVSDYDYSAGLQRHIGMVQAGAPMPDWAKGLEAGAGKGAAAAAAGTGLVGWWALPVATVAVAAAIGATVLFRSEETLPHARPHGAGEVVAPSPVVPAAPAVAPAAPVAAQPQPSEQAQPSQGEARSGTRRAGSAQRSSQAKHAQAVANAHAAASNGSSASNGGKGDLFANAPAASGTRSAQAKAQAVTASGASATSAQADRAPGAQAQPEQDAVATSDEPVAQKPEPVVDDTRLEREMGMLAVAQRVLQVDPARTLSLARQGEAEFSGSMFTPERKQLELLALVKLGRLDEAKRLARPYLARYPNGPFSDRVRRALSTGRVDR